MIGSTICNGCGVNIALFRQSEKVFEDAKADNLEEYVLEHENFSHDKRSTRRELEKKLFLTRLKHAIITSICIGLFILTSAFLVGKYIRNRQEKAIESFNQAIACLETQDYTCARNYFSNAKKFGYPEELINPFYLTAIINSASLALEQGQLELALDQANECLLMESGQPDCMNVACTSKVQLAERYLEIAQWKLAISLTDDVIFSCPDSNKAKKIQEQTFQRWHDDAKSRLNFLEVWNVDKQWTAHFPERETNK